MTNLKHEFNELLTKYSAPCTIVSKPMTAPRIDHFLDEAYKLNDGITELDTFLKDIRQSYLSRETPHQRFPAKNLEKNQRKHLTNRDKDEIDAKAKQLIRKLNAGIRMLAETEEVRRQTELAISNKKMARSGFGALGAWAAGGFPQFKSVEQELADAKATTITTHRESVVFYLRQRLEKCASQQASMMEKRISRELEKNRSILGQGYSDHVLDFDSLGKMKTTSKSNLNVAIPQYNEQIDVKNELTPEQIQVFEKENQDMLRHFETTLDQVRTAEKSMAEISELQSQLVQNLATQTSHIDQLVADSHLTTENVGGGNKQLKQATERPSTAKYVFYASCGLSFFLVVWDLII
ncbi:hypothetical protein K3495_g2258 [Podosphaera aphanis]|nr:hypothetical protein K3495_g2258 [Podosphaera aphanis]